MATIISIFLWALGIYFAMGILFALHFAFFGATRLDPLMANSKKVVRLLLFPGVVATWPFLLKKSIKKST